MTAGKPTPVKANPKTLKTLDMKSKVRSYTRIDRAHSRHVMFGAVKDFLLKKEELRKCYGPSYCTSSCFGHGGARAAACREEMAFAKARLLDAFVESSTQLQVDSDLKALFGMIRDKTDPEDHYTEKEEGSDLLIDFKKNQIIPYTPNISCDNPIKSLLFETEDERVQTALLCALHEISWLQMALEARH